MSITWTGTNSVMMKTQSKARRPRNGILAIAKPVVIESSSWSAVTLRAKMHELISALMVKTAIASLTFSIRIAAGTQLGG